MDRPNPSSALSHHYEDKSMENGRGSNSSISSNTSVISSSTLATSCSSFSSATELEKTNLRTASPKRSSNYSRPRAFGYERYTTDQKYNIFPCQYQWCIRSERPFARQDGLTEHLRKIHKHEDPKYSPKTKRRGGVDNVDSSVPIDNLTHQAKTNPSNLEDFICSAKDSDCLFVGTREEMKEHMLSAHPTDQTTPDRTQRHHKSTKASLSTDMLGFPLQVFSTNENISSNTLPQSPYLQIADMERALPIALSNQINVQSSHQGCNAKFESEHEMQKHSDRARYKTRKVYVCAPLLRAPDFLSKTNCNLCASFTEYKRDYTAGEHLKRYHFNTKKPGPYQSRSKVTSGDQLSLRELRHYMVTYEIDTHGVRTSAPQRVIFSSDVILPQLPDLRGPEDDKLAKDDLPLSPRYLGVASAAFSEGSHLLENHVPQHYPCDMISQSGNVFFDKDTLLNVSQAESGILQPFVQRELETDGNPGAINIINHHHSHRTSTDSQSRTASSSQHSSSIDSNEESTGSSGSSDSQDMAVDGCAELAILDSKNRIIANLMHQVYTVFDPAWVAKLITCAPHSSQSASRTPREAQLSLDNTSGSCRCARDDRNGKRKADDEDDEASGNEKGNKKGRSTTISKNTTKSRNFACPFTKFDPKKYCVCASNDWGQNYQACWRGENSISHLK